MRVDVRVTWLVAVAVRVAVGVCVVSPVAVGVVVGTSGGSQYSTTSLGRFDDSGASDE